MWKKVVLKFHNCKHCIAVGLLSFFCVKWSKRRWIARGHYTIRFHGERRQLAICIMLKMLGIQLIKVPTTYFESNPVEKWKLKKKFLLHWVIECRSHLVLVTVIASCEYAMMLIKDFLVLISTAIKTYTLSKI